MYHRAYTNSGCKCFRTSTSNDHVLKFQVQKDFCEHEYRPACDMHS